MNLKSLLKTIKLHESAISMFLGAIVIVAIGVVIINYFSNSKGETVPPLEIEEVSTDTKTHIVQEGEDLWKISEKYYGSGFEWSKIAEVNNINDPNQIKVGQTLIIPPLKEEIAQANPTVVTITPGKEELKESPTPTKTPTLTGVEEEKIEEKEAFLGEHTVAKGENLWVIAEKYYKSGYNWIDIAKANKVKNPNLIFEGQKLSIPSVKAKPETLKKELATEISEPITGDSYKVVKGDSLWTIAQRAYGDGFRWINIAKENKLSNPRIIHPGNELRIPR